MSDFNPYEDIDPLAFAEIAKGFDFRSPRLGVVDFPDGFVRDYVRIFENSAALDETDALYSPPTLGHGIIMFDNIFGPGDIFSINKILDESLYAETGSIIIPPGFYVVAECYDSIGKVYLAVNLDKEGADHGKMFFWRKVHDALGTGDNTNPPAFAANNLGAYFAGLMTEAEAEKRSKGR